MDCKKYIRTGYPLEKDGPWLRQYEERYKIVCAYNIPTVRKLFSITKYVWYNIKRKIIVPQTSEVFR